MLIPVVSWPACEILFINPIQVIALMAHHDDSFPAKDKSMTLLKLTGMPTFPILGRVDIVMGCLGGEEKDLRYYQQNYIDRVKNGAISPPKVETASPSPQLIRPE